MSGKALPPPDFVNDDDRIMMEVMRIDDRTRTDNKGKAVNPLNALESKRQREIKDLQKTGEFPTSKNGVFINAITDLPSFEDHNYSFYVNGFKRVLEKHKDSIELYRNNHPGYKLVFFIFDESTPYILAKDSQTASNGVVFKKKYRFKCADIHFPFMDKRFVEELYGLDVDYVFWYMPFKHINSRKKLPVPIFAAIDVKHADSLLLHDYPLDRIMSFEE